ncbi:MAG TPA: hypothetical protein VFX85_13410 [Solirubrobacterales bacterium]|nr:hypothetical protein [Solirubrobacterales bacterium]
MVVAALALAASAPASAEIRYAAPGGGVAEPCNPTPCSLAKAVDGAKAGDQVVLAAGNYTANADLLLNKAIDVGGAPGAATSVDFVGGSAAIVENAAATLHDVRLSFAEPTMGYVLSLEAGTVERVYADGTNGIACQMDQGLLRDSVCFGELFATPYGAGNYNGAIVNVTANQLMVGAHEKAKFTATITNSILLTEEGGIGELSINVGDGASAAVTTTNSSFAAVDTTLSAGTDFTFTPAGTNGNQTVAPQLVDPANGDFRPLASSPTVDSGTTLAQFGLLDLAGGPRLQPACIGGPPMPDIGAYEFVPTVVCPGLPPAPEDPSASVSAPAPKPAIGLLDFGKLTRDPAKGTATLPVVLPAGGEVVMRGEGLVRRKAGSSRAATLKLIVKAKGAKLAKLRETGKVKLWPAFVFTPSTGGAPQTVVKPVTLKLAAEQRAQ